MFYKNCDTVICKLIGWTITSLLPMVWQIWKNKIEKRLSKSMKKFFLLKITIFYRIKPFQTILLRRLQSVFWPHLCPKIGLKSHLRRHTHRPRSLSPHLFRPCSTSGLRTRNLRSGPTTGERTHNWQRDRPQIVNPMFHVAVDCQDNSGHTR